METIETIMAFELKKYDNIDFYKALDLFEESVENYKKATKRQKLKCVAQVFIKACIVMNIEYLTGAQCMEIFNNIATDYGADKDVIEKEINKQMKKERKDYEKSDFIKNITPWDSRYVKRLHKIKTRL